MKPAAIGIRMHSGWGVLVAVDDESEIIERRRIVVINDDMPGGKQPFHQAANLGLPKGEQYLAAYTVEAGRLAREAIAATIAELRVRGFSVKAAALVLASGRTLPPLAQILSAHPLIHTAEGELFREAVRRACESLNIPVMGYRENELKAPAKQLSAHARQTIANAGKLLGPPWTADHKSASQAACLALKEKTRAKD